MDQLPEPDSDELRSIVGRRRDLLAIYRHLYEARERGITMVELEERCTAELGRLSQFGRRKRDLHPAFEIEHFRVGRTYLHRLVRRIDGGALDDVIPEVLRAQVLAFGRCAMCGKTTLGDHVKLHVDHKIPRTWGGETQLENLQPLCSQCNQGKKAWFASIDKYGEIIKYASSLDDPWLRLGEALKGIPGKVPSAILQLIAGETHQGDWKKRIRELHYILRWSYRTHRRRVGKVTEMSYELLQDRPWPPEGPAEAIRRHEQKRRLAKRRREAS